MSLKIKYIDSPANAQSDASATATSRQPFGFDAQITAGAKDIPWATLEPASWSLDGSRIAIDENPNNIGWWSKDRTDADGRFNTPPVITINFSEAYTATGLTFLFWPSLNEWCNEMKVSFYNGDTVLFNMMVYPDSPTWVLESAVDSFNKIVVEIYGTNIPGQFAKIQQIQIGHMVIFMQDEIVSVSLLNEIDPSLCSLSVDTMTVEILEKKNRAIIPQQNQAMYLYRNEEQIAAQYITDSSRENQRSYTFTCQSAIGRLESTFMGGVYNGYRVGALLGSLLSGFKSDYSEFADDTITGYLPVCTKREALQQVAFAIGAIVTTQGDGTIRLVRPDEEDVSEFTDDHIFTGSKLVKEAQTASVSLTVHSYAKGSETETLLENEPVNGTRVLYVFDEPHHNYTITNGEIKGSGDNYVYITADGNVTLTAKKYIHSTSVRTKENQFATAAEKGNVLSVDNATLIHAGNADNALDRLYEYSQLNNVLTEDVVVTNQSAGQKVKSKNPWGGSTTGYITSMESDFTNTGHTASVTIRGKGE